MRSLLRRKHRVCSLMMAAGLTVLLYVYIIPIIYSYTDSNDSLVMGQPMKIPTNYSQLLGPGNNLVNLSNHSPTDLVFVTAVSSNHFAESLDAVGSVQSHFPNHIIIYYDLGLKQPQIKELRTLCSVTYVKFNFDLYPRHIRMLKACSWKPIIVQENLHKYGGVFWFDASIRFKTGNISYVYDTAFANGGVAISIQTRHSIYAATNPGMYTIIPIDIEAAKHTEMYGATCYLVYNTEKVQRELMHWLVACALYEKCISPVNQFVCHFPKERFHNGESSFIWGYAKCHRYDQSAINLILSNMFNHNYKRYRVAVSGKKWVDHIHRPTSYYKPHVCPK